MPDKASNVAGASKKMIMDLWKSWKYYRRFLGTNGAISAAKGRIRNSPELFEMSSPEASFPFDLRVPSSDVGVYSQVFLKHEYKFEVNKTPSFIVDAGANIGLASIFFASRFPGTRILAIEPEKTNFEVLVKNTALYPNIIPVHAALWGDNAEIDVVDPGLGNWGFMTAAQGGTAKQMGQKVQGMTLDSIFDQYGIQRISIFKSDIEGAELEVFRNSSSWIDRIDSLIVELHEHMKPGCNRTFHRATDDFAWEWTQGELVYLTRDGGCLKPPARACELSSRKSELKPAGLLA
jgi:FkbM family methyltransferase